MDLEDPWGPGNITNHGKKSQFDACWNGIDFKTYTNIRMKSHSAIDEQQEWILKSRMMK